MTSSPASESLEHARFAVVDVETTGVRAQVGGRILEVAVAILEGGTIHLAFEALLNPGTPIPLWVERLTGITDGMVAGRPRFGDVVAGFGRALDAAVFVAIENPARHRAFGDALATAHVLRALLGRARERGVETVEQLIEVHERPRHRMRNAECGMRNVSGEVEPRANSHVNSAFRIPP